jgi:hypothetical protein
MHGEIVFLVVSVPHLTTNDDNITGWHGVNDPKEMKNHHAILHPAHAVHATPTSVFDLLCMVLPLPFNHGAISGKPMGAQVIKAWSVFSDEDDNSHQWLDTPFFTDGQRLFPQALNKSPHVGVNPRPITGIRLPVSSIPLLFI